MSRFGGWNRVDRQRVRKAILDSDLSPLISRDPSAAGVLIKQAVLDDEARSRRSWVDGELNITDAPRWLLAVPERGPFLRLLLEDARIGIECIVAVTEAATQKWVEREAAEPQGGEDGEWDGFSVLVDGTERKLLGGPEVLLWSSSAARAPTVLTCALMVLEAHLYRALEAKEDIGERVALLMESRSLAIWGVLASVALRSPSLMRKELLALTSSPDLLMADKLSSARLGSAPMVGAGDQAYMNRAVKWRDMPHRKTPLCEHLMAESMRDEDLAAELKRSRERWAAEDEERWKHLIAQLDPANRRLQRDSEGTVFLTYEAPAELQPEIEASNKEVSDAQGWLMLPYRIKDWIEEESQPSPDEMETFWVEAQELLARQASEDNFRDGVRTREDLECGVAALFVICGREWLLANPERDSWCRTALLSPFKGEPPETHPFDSAEDLSEERWDAFCARAIPILWAEHPGDPDLRAAAARLAVNPHHLTVRLFFRTAANQPGLCSAVRELEHLSLYWARYLAWRREVHHREEAAKYPDEQEKPAPLPDLKAPTQRAIDAFVKEDLCEEAPELRQWVAETPAAMLASPYNRRHRLLYSVELGYLICARTHLAESRGGEDERARRVRLAEDLSSALLEDLGKRDVEGEYENPYSDEEAALRWLADLTLSASPEETRGIWEPMLAAGVDSGNWTRCFLSELWSQRFLGAAGSAAGLSELLRAMLDFYMESANPSGDWLGRDLDLELIGLSAYSPLLHGDHGELLAALQPQWEEWVTPRMSHAWFAVRVTRLVGSDSGAPVRSLCLRLLSEGERSETAPSSDLDEETANLLLAIYAKEPELIRGSGDAASDARFLLARLAGRGDPLALELSARLG